MLDKMGRAIRVHMIVRLPPHFGTRDLVCIFQAHFQAKFIFQVYYLASEHTSLPH
jgi:hypothetical protein